MRGCAARDLRWRQGAQIREIRRAKGLSCRDIAEQLDTCEAAVRHWENGRHSPRLNQQIALAELLGVKHSSLFGLDVEAAS